MVLKSIVECILGCRHEYNNFQKKKKKRKSSPSRFASYKESLPCVLIVPVSLRVVGVGYLNVNCEMEVSWQRGRGVIYCFCKFSKKKIKKKKKKC